MRMGLLERRLLGADETGAVPAAKRERAGQAASAVGVGANALLFAVKLAAGAASGSLSITADAFNNLSDASSSVVSLLGFKLAGRPADEEHPYGHGRYEYLCALLVAVMILVIGLELLTSGVRRIFAPKDVTLGAAGYAVLVFSIGLKLWLAAFFRRVSRRIDARTLAAAADDSRGDVLATGAVLAGALIRRATGAQLDGLLSVLVAAVILLGGVKLLRETLGLVLGRMPDAEELDAIRAKVLAYPGVLGAHDLMVHDYGPGRQFATVHVEMSATEDPLASHEVIDRIERDFLAERGLHLVVHYDPVAVNDPRLPLLRELIEGEMAKIDPGLGAHDLRISQRADGPLLTFDCVVPYGSRVNERELAARLARAVSAEYPLIRCAVTFERGRGQDGVGQ